MVVVTGSVLFEVSLGSLARDIIESSQAHGAGCSSVCITKLKKTLGKLEYVKIVLPIRRGDYLTSE